MTVSSVARQKYRLNIDILKRNGKIIHFKALLDLFLPKIFARHVKGDEWGYLFSLASSNVEKNVLATRSTVISKTEVSPPPWRSLRIYCTIFFVTKSRKEVRSIDNFPSNVRTLSTPTRAFVMLSTLSERMSAYNTVENWCVDLIERRFYAWPTFQYRRRYLSKSRVGKFGRLNGIRLTSMWSVAGLKCQKVWPRFRYCGCLLGVVATSGWINWAAGYSS